LSSKSTEGIVDEFQSGLGRKLKRWNRWYSAIGKYLVALVSILVATLVRMLVDPIVGELHPFVTYIFAILFCAWYGGLGPAILSLILGFSAAAYFFASPRAFIALHGTDVQFGLVLYIILSISSIVFSKQMHSGKMPSSNKLHC
jgi:K+-sensing histidine kinase KdpD